VSELPAEFFEDDPAAARRRFRGICEDAGLEICTIGDWEEDGFVIDAARIDSPDAPSVLVLTSGAGEGEGLCASAIQCCALAGPVRRELPREVGILFVHSVAPEWQQTLPNATFSVPERAWEDALLVAAETRYEEFVREGKTLRINEDDAVEDDSKEAPSPEQELEKLMEVHLGRATRIGVLDVRTGPGEFGRCDVIACAGKATPAGRRAGLWFGARAELDDASSRAVPGPLAQSLIAALPPAELAAAVMEFGTYSLEAMLGTSTGRMFYPDDPAWRIEVWKKAHAVIRRAMKVMQRP